MLQDWHKEIQRLLVLVAVAGLAGLVLGHPISAILLAVSAYLILVLRQLYRLDQWLASIESGLDLPTPDGRGIFGPIFDGIYRLRQRHELATREVQKILDKAQASSSALKIAVILIDQEGNLAWWNQAGQTLLGLRYPVDRNQNVTNLIRNPKFLEYFHHQQFNEALVMNSPINGNVVLEIQLSGFGAGESLMVARDITQLHKLEMMRKEFVANVSHELRTPITVISGYLETLLENIDQIEPRWRKPLQQMQQQSRRMENIVRDLLMLARLETNPPARVQASIDLGTLLHEVAEETVRTFEGKHHNIQVNSEPGLKLRCDANELFSAVSNLAFNAAKYTPVQGKIQLRSDVENGTIKISVIDNGIGIEPQHIPRLTERFYRVDASRSSTTGGTGLGLAIVKHVLLRHNASLEIESSPGKGSRFTCHFPLSGGISKPEAEDASEKNCS